MRTLILPLTILIFFSCSTESQNSDAAIDKDTSFILIKDVEKFSAFEIDTIPDIKSGVNERSASFIKNRLVKLIGRSYEKRCDDIGVSYPPKYVLFRAFKFEQEYEIWVGNKRSDSLKLLITVPICAVDYNPGPKLRQGDGKTPEGFYTCKIMYGSSNGFMWIKLNNSEIDDFGTVGYGSGFKLCLEYPLQTDRARTRRFLGNVSPGSAICIHGNCVTAGCISFENKDYLPIFLSARFHDSKTYGYPKIHIFPFRFTEEKIAKYSKEVYSEMKPQDLEIFWNELKVAYDLFEKKRKAIRVSFPGNKYNFTEY